MENITRISSYDNEKYPFAQVILTLYKRHLIDINDLSNLHQVLPVIHADVPLVNVDTDQSSVFHKAFYEHMYEEYLPLYERFMREFARPFFGAPIVYQSIPTFRVALPNNLAVGEFHRDSDYNHPIESINWWVPLTKAFDTNTVWIESAALKKDFKPQELSPGQFLIFKGALLEHGNKLNTTGRTRVSFDLRIIPLAEYRDSEKSTISQHKKLIIGDFFSVCE